MNSSPLLPDHSTLQTVEKEAGITYRGGGELEANWQVETGQDRSREKIPGIKTKVGAPTRKKGVHRKRTPTKHQGKLGVKATGVWRAKEEEFARVNKPRGT